MLLADRHEKSANSICLIYDSHLNRDTCSMIYIIHNMVSSTYGRKVFFVSTEKDESLLKYIYNFQRNKSGIIWLIGERLLHLWFTILNLNKDNWWLCFILWYKLMEKIQSKNNFDWQVFIINPINWNPIV